MKSSRIPSSHAPAQQSWSVLKMDKSLLLFPLVSGLATLLLAAAWQRKS